MSRWDVGKCKRGHMLTPSNLRNRSDSNRECLTCYNAYRLQVKTNARKRSKLRRHEKLGEYYQPRFDAYGADYFWLELVQDLPEVTTGQLVTITQRTEARPPLPEWDHHLYFGELVRDARHQSRGKDIQPHGGPRRRKTYSKPSMLRYDLNPPPARYSVPQAVRWLIGSYLQKPTPTG